MKSASVLISACSGGAFYSTYMYLQREGDMFFLGLENGSSKIFCLKVPGQYARSVASVFQGVAQERSVWWRSGVIGWCRLSCSKPNKYNVVRIHPMIVGLGFHASILFCDQHKLADFGRRWDVLLSE